MKSTATLRQSLLAVPPHPQEGGRPFKSKRHAGPFPFARQFVTIDTSRKYYDTYNEH
jgi:hypothetical protein